MRVTTTMNQQKAAVGVSAIDPASLSQVVLDLPWVNANILDAGDPPSPVGNNGNVQSWVDASASLNNFTSGALQYVAASGVRNPGTDACATGSTITLTGDFTIWVWCVVSASPLYLLGRQTGTSAVLITGDLIRIGTDLGDNYSSGGNSLSLGLKLVRIRRASGQTYFAWTGRSELAAETNDLGAQVPTFNTILAASTDGFTPDAFSGSDAYLKWLVIADESVTPLTANQRAGVELYIAGASL